MHIADHNRRSARSLISRQKTAQTQRLPAHTSRMRPKSLPPLESVDKHIATARDMPPKGGKVTRRDRENRLKATPQDLRELQNPATSKVRSRANVRHCITCVTLCGAAQTMRMNARDSRLGIRRTRGKLGTVHAKMTNMINRLLERHLPERRIFVRSESETRYLRLTPLTQFAGLAGGTVVIVWMTIASAIVLMDSIGSGNLREQANRDLVLYEAPVDTACQRARHPRKRGRRRTGAFQPRIGTDFRHAIRTSRLRGACPRTFQRD